jgi:P27 family predicted phage terminase small subunit
MMSGRRPIPSALKVLAGNPGKRRLNRREPKPIVQLPPCPAHLKDVARQAWRQIGQRLTTLRVVTEADGPALELLCLAYQEYRRAIGVVERRGPTYATRTPTGMIVRRRPEVAIASDAWRRVKAMLVEFGLTPAARSRVAAEPPAADDAEQFLFGVRRS